MARWVRKAGILLLASPAHPRQVRRFLEMDQKWCFDPSLNLRETKTLAPRTPELWESADLELSVVVWTHSEGLPSEPLKTKPESDLQSRGEFEFIFRVSSSLCIMPSNFPCGQRKLCL